MVIYATEFVLWCGVFACGGYFNLTPWVRQKVSTRRQTKREAEIDLRETQDGSGDQMEGTGVSNDLELRQVPSSTTVFRTPSSVISGRPSLRTITNE
jgi:hypothetical protein